MKKHQFPTYKAISTSYNSMYNDHRGPSCKQKGDLFGAKNPSPLACEKPKSSKSMTGWFEGPSGIRLPTSPTWKTTPTSRRVLTSNTGREVPSSGPSDSYQISIPFTLVFLVETHNQKPLRLEVLVNNV